VSRCSPSSTCARRERAPLAVACPRARRRPGRRPDAHTWRGLSAAAKGVLGRVCASLAPGWRRDLSARSLATSGPQESRGAAAARAPVDGRPQHVRANRRSYGGGSGQSPGSASHGTHASPLPHASSSLSRAICSASSFFNRASRRRKSRASRHGLRVAEEAAALGAERGGSAHVVVGRLHRDPGFFCPQRRTP